MPSLFEIGPVVLEKKILKVINLFVLFFQLSPIDEGGDPSFE